MNKGIAFFMIGLVIFMLGLYLSINLVEIGTLLGVSGGILMGISSYFSAKKNNRIKR